MNLLNKHKSEIISLCVKHKVKGLYAFGSILTEDFNKQSDIDFVVEFNHFDPALYADNYYELKFSLQGYFAASDRFIRAAGIEKSIRQAEHSGPKTTYLWKLKLRHGSTIY